MLLNDAVFVLIHELGKEGVVRFKLLLVTSNMLNNQKGLTTGEALITHKQLLIWRHRTDNRRLVVVVVIRNDWGWSSLTSCG